MTFMVFDKGKTRFVVAFPWLGFSLKFPIVHISELSSTVRVILKSGLEAGIAPWKTSVKNPYSARYQLAGGFISNWIEWQLWKRTKNPLLQPTWFSFFGLFNIQKYGKPLSHSDAPRLSMIMQKATRQTSHAWGRSHTFGVQKNYTEVDGCLRLLDYGSKRLWVVILRYGKQIAKITVAECMYPPSKEK